MHFPPLPERTANGCLIKALSPIMYHTHCTSSMVSAMRREARAFATMGNVIS